MTSQVEEPETAPVARRCAAPGARSAPTALMARLRSRVKPRREAPEVRGERRQSVGQGDADEVVDAARAAERSAPAPRPARRRAWRGSAGPCPAGRRGSMATPTRSWTSRRPNRRCRARIGQRPHRRLALAGGVSHQPGRRVRSPERQVRLAVDPGPAFRGTDAIRLPSRRRSRCPADAPPHPASPAQQQPRSPTASGARRPGARVSLSPPRNSPARHAARRQLRPPGGAGARAPRTRGAPRAPRAPNQDERVEPEVRHLGHEPPEPLGEGGDHHLGGLLPDLLGQSRVTPGEKPRHVRARARRGAPRLDDALDRVEDSLRRARGRRRPGPRRGRVESGEEARAAPRVARDPFLVREDRAGYPRRSPRRRPRRADDGPEVSPFCHSACRDRDQKWSTGWRESAREPRRSSRRP